MNLVLIGIFFLAVLKDGFSLKCYTCDTPNNCLKQNLQAVKCSEDQVCIKTDKRVSGDKIVKKGCYSVPEDKRKEACQVMKNGKGQEEIVCLCFSKDLCNYADVNVNMEKVTLISMFLATFAQFI